MAKPTVDLTSKLRVLPDGRKFPKTPKPQVIKESFGSVEVVKSDKRKTWSNIIMAIKKYRCTINWLHGCEFFDVIVKANSERKARIRAKDKVIKERGDHFCMVCGCEEMKEESYALCKK